MKKTVDKQFLKQYKTLCIMLENLEWYEIDVEDILDIYCEIESIGKQKNQFRTNDGFIKISANAAQLEEYSVLQNPRTSKISTYRLQKRLELCGGVDMTYFSLQDQERNHIDIHVPYDPLEEIFHGNEIELSNCPSLEIDTDGNMIVAFGASSKQPKRKDNNYAELVTGWTEIFGAFEPKELHIFVHSLKLFGVDEKTVSLSFQMQTPSCKKQFAKLVFTDCKNISIELFFPEKGECNILMSKMASGQIYVGLEGLGVEFVCASVKMQ